MLLSWAWGDNVYGQLGDGTTSDRGTPVQVSGLTSVAAIAAGNLHSLAVKDDGSVWTWGYNAYGQLGVGQTITPYSYNNYKTTPSQLSNFAGVKSIAGGGNFSAALKNDNTLWTWGAASYLSGNNYGELGDGTLVGKTTPVQVLWL